MLSTKSPALFVLVTLLSVLMIALLHGIALTQTSDKRVKNYDECIRAGYPTANPYRLAQEQCWTTNYGFFFKDLKPTIKQGVYGRVILNTGNCSLRTVEPGLRGMLSRLFTRDSCHYELVNRRRIYVFGRFIPVQGDILATEVFLKSHHPVAFVDMKNGFYEVPLAVGEYLFATEDDGKLHPIWPIVVEPGELREVHLSINKAVE